MTSAALTVLVIRADSSISSGSIIRCITPMRKGWDVTVILSWRGLWER
jgi:hypothetical protein